MVDLGLETKFDEEFNEPRYLPIKVRAQKKNLHFKKLFANTENNEIENDDHPTFPPDLIDIID